MANINTLKPIFYITDDNQKILKDIEKKLALLSIDDPHKKRNLQTKSKVRSIYSSLAIEDNSLSLKSVENIVEQKPTLGNRKEIQEVKNANELYEHIKEYNWRKEKDLLKAHTLMMKYFDDDNGYYRNHGEGVKRGKKIIFTAPESILVPSLMKNLFTFMNENENKIHPLILAALFHYYFVYIHPFSDGNGRMARFWVSLILTNWNAKFAFIPIEEEIYLRQQEYYDSISQCHINGNANVFINFLLKCINFSLEKTTQKTTQTLKLNQNQLKIIELIKENSQITRNELANILHITPDGVKYNLKKLVDYNIIERIGPNNGGYWQLKNSKEELECLN